MFVLTGVSKSRCVEVKRVINIRSSHSFNFVHYHVYVYINDTTGVLGLIFAGYVPLASQSP